PVANTSRPTSSAFSAMATMALIRSRSVGVRPVVGSGVTSPTLKIPNCIPLTLQIVYGSTISLERCARTSYSPCARPSARVPASGPAARRAPAPKRAPDLGFRQAKADRAGSAGAAPVPRPQPGGLGGGEGGGAAQEPDEEGQPVAVEVGEQGRPGPAR